MESIEKMDKSQHGSRKGRSTISQLLEHHKEIIDILEREENVDCIYLDFSKAFDKCDTGIMHTTSLMAPDTRLKSALHTNKNGSKC